MLHARVHERSEDDARQPCQGARPDAEILDAEIERQVQQLDRPEQCDEAQRELSRQPEVGASAGGVRVRRVGYVDPHRGTEYQSAPCELYDCGHAVDTRAYSSGESTAAWLSSSIRSRSRMNCAR